MILRYDDTIDQAIRIQKEYWELGPLILGGIKRPMNKHNPDSLVNMMSINFVYSGGNLTGQILRSIKRGDLQLGIIGVRTLFEMSVNAVYIFNHPKIGQNNPHMRRVCRDIVRLASISNRKASVNHARIDNNKAFKDRLTDVGMGRLYKTNYRIMSEWTHLMTKTIHFYKNPEIAQDFGLRTAAVSLYSLHNIYDSIAVYCKYDLNPKLQKFVEEFNSSYCN